MPRLNRLLLIHAGAIDAIVVHRLDRLSRKLKDIADRLNELGRT